LSAHQRQDEIGTDDDEDPLIGDQRERGASSNVDPDDPDGPGDGKADAPRALAASTPAAATPTASLPKNSQPLDQPKARDLEPPNGAQGFTVRPDRKII